MAGDTIKQNNGPGSISMPQAAIFFAVALYFSLFFLYQQYITNMDYAKLVRYGEVIVQDGKVFTTNTFSYTHPDYPFVNHHWGVGVVFYGLHSLGGFKALTVFVALMNLAAFLIMGFYALRKGNYWMVLTSIFILLPELASRSQPRPEAFSILFLVITLWLLHRYMQGEIRQKVLWVLPFIQLLWVNLHILFFLGLFVQGVVFLHLLINRAGRQKVLAFLYVLLASVALSFVNPSGWEGFMYPLFIMQDIQYGVSENSPLFSLLYKRSDTTSILNYEVIFLLIAMLLYFWIKNRRLKTHFYLVVWLTAFAVLALWRIRANVFMAYVVILAVSQVSAMWGEWHSKNVTRWSISILTVVMLLVLIPGYVRYNPYAFQKEPGFGIADELKGAGKYFRLKGLEGPVFNNFDSGDYLIYHLFPEEKVFVDSRPEAYPPGFFKDVLLPAINNQEAWLKLESQYQFNVVFLAYHPQVRKMAERLFNDSKWFPAYYDKKFVIFLKRTAENDRFIRKELMDELTLRNIMRNFDFNEEQRLWH